MPVKICSAIRSAAQRIVWKIVNNNNNNTNYNNTVFLLFYLSVFVHN